MYSFAVLAIALGLSLFTSVLQAEAQSKIDVMQLQGPMVREATIESLQSKNIPKILEAVGSKQGNWNIKRNFIELTDEGLTRFSFNLERAHPAKKPEPEKGIWGAFKGYISSAASFALDYVVQAEVVGTVQVSGDSENPFILIDLSESSYVVRACIEQIRARYSLVSTEEGTEIIQTVDLNTGSLFPGDDDPRAIEAVEEFTEFLKGKITEAIETKEVELIHKKYSH